MKRMHEYNNEDEPLILFSKATCLYLVVVGNLSVIYKIMSLSLPKLTCKAEFRNGPSLYR